MQISVARCFNYDTFLHLLVHAGVPSHGSILRSFSGRILTSTAEAPSRKGDQGDEGWHHNQVWAAGGAVITSASGRRTIADAICNQSLEVLPLTSQTILVTV